MNYPYQTEKKIVTRQYDSYLDSYLHTYNHIQLTHNMSYELLHINSKKKYH